MVALLSSRPQAPTKQVGRITTACTMVLALLPALALVLVPAVAEATPTPVPCTSIGSGRYDCTFYPAGDGLSGGAPVQASDGHRVGYLNQGTNFIICQATGAEVTSGPYRNRYWAYTEANDRAYGWVNAVWATGGTNDGSYGGVPACSASHGRPPQTTGGAGIGGGVGGGAAGNQSAKVLNWAYRHVNWWAGLYSMGHRLPVKLSVAQMQRQEPPKGRGTPTNVKQGCDCSSFVRWAYAQAGIDAGTYTATIWTANGKLGGLSRTSTSVNLPTGHAARGWGSAPPPGGWHPGDLVFYGVTHMTRGVGHVAIYMGNNRIVQCSGNRGSNQGRSLTSPGTITGWVRYDRISG